MTLPKTKRRKGVVEAPVDGVKFYRSFFLKRWGIEEEK